MINKLREWAEENKNGLISSGNNESGRIFTSIMEAFIKKISELESEYIKEVEKYLEGKVHDIDMPGWDSAVSYNDAIAALQALARDKDAEIDNQVNLFNQLETEYAKLTAEVERLRGGWIKVEERLPELGQEVLSYSKDDGIKQSTYRTYAEGSYGHKQGWTKCWFEWITHDKFCMAHKATHWQPLPPNPQP